MNKLLVKMKNYVLIFFMSRLCVKQKQSNVPTSENVKNIVLWQFGGVGDMLLATPVVLALSKRFPNAKIHIWCSDPNFATFLKYFPQVEAIHAFVVYDFDMRTLLHQTQRQKLHHVLHNMQRIKPDLLVNLHVPALLDWWAVEWWLMQRLEPTFKMGFYPETVKNNTFLDASLSSVERKNIHYTTLYQKLLGKADITCGVDTLFPVPKESYHKAKFLLEQSGVIRGKTYVCVHMGGRRLKVENKMWAVSSFEELIRKIIGQGLCPVLIGVPSEQSLGDQLCSEVSGVVNLIGKTNIDEMVALISLADGFIGHDSGPFHIAVAVATPAVAICGRPDSEPEYLKYDKDHVVVLMADTPDDIQVDDVFHHMLETLDV